MITVWGRRNSVNVQKVLWALEELDVPYTRENVGGHFGGNRDADFLAMNPMGLVPVIRDGDVTMFESNAIVRYLAARFRSGVLRPDEHRSLAMAEQWMDWQQLAFAPAVKAKIATSAVGVMFVGAGTGGETAAPAARGVLSAMLAQR